MRIRNFRIVSYQFLYIVSRPETLLTAETVAIQMRSCKKTTLYDLCNVASGMLLCVQGQIEEEQGQIGVRSKGWDLSCACILDSDWENQTKTRHN